MYPTILCVGRLFSITPAIKPFADLALAFTNNLLVWQVAGLTAPTRRKHRRS